MTLREKIARAIWGVSHNEVWDEMVDGRGKAFYMAQADAVIEALGERTDEEEQELNRWQSECTNPNQGA